MPPQAALFDLDGTLLDTLEDLADCMNIALAEQGFPPVPLQEHRFMVGDGVRNYALRAIGDGGLPEPELDRFIARYRDLYAENWAARTRPYDGVEEMLAGLREAGVTLAVLSNKPDGFTRKMVDHYLGGVEFAVVRGAMEGVPLKPAPAAAVAIARQLGVDPGRFLYLGDTDTDMQTARAAGMYAVGVAWGFRPVEELRENGAQAIVAAPPDVLDLL